MKPAKGPGNKRTVSTYRVTGVVERGFSIVATEYAMNQRLARLINKTYRNPENGCWEFQGQKTWFGYGRLSHWYAHGKHGIAHRCAYEELVGPIPDGMVVMHRCDNPSCVNPDHLRIGTQSDNCRDRNEKGRAVDNSGTNNANAKLRPRDVIEIRRSTESTASLARKFGCGWTTIDHVRKGRNWRQVQ